MGKWWELLRHHFPRNPPTSFPRPRTKLLLWSPLTHYALTSLFPRATCCSRILLVITSVQGRHL